MRSRSWFAISAFVALAISLVIRWHSDWNIPVSHVLKRLGLARVVVLRLPREASRAVGLIEDAKTLDLPIEFLDSSDGVHDERFRSLVLPLHLPGGGTCADIVGSIFDTHERAWIQAAEQKESPTLVLEDDVRLPPDFIATFVERAAKLPSSYDMAFVGTSITPNAKRISEYLAQPDQNDPNKQALLGFWGYVVTPVGARKLLDLVKKERRDGRRTFQPVDLFIAHRLRKLKVYVFEPTAHLAQEFERNPDRHHVLETMRHVGIVRLAQTPTTNAPLADAEQSEIVRLKDLALKHGEEGRPLKSWKVSRRALRTIKRYSCWNVAIILQNAGLALLHNLEQQEEGVASLGSANNTLLVALEAFGSATRYVQGTWMERQKKQTFPGWINNMMHVRSQKGFSPVAPPAGWGSKVALPNESGWIEASNPPMLLEHVRKH